MPSNTKPHKGKSKRLVKYHLLLAEGLSLPTSYPKINSFHHLKHIVHDLNKSGIKKDKPSVIALSTNLSNKEADLKILKVLKELKAVQAKGHLISISKINKFFQWFS